MRTITIGDRKLSDMTENELSVFLSKFGLCASLEYFHEPVFSDFEFDKKDGNLYFVYSCTRKSDGHVVSRNGWIYFYSGLRKTPDPGIVSFRNQNSNDMDSKRFDIMQLGYLINLGFDIPIFDNLKNYFTDFNSYEDFKIKYL